MKTLRECIAEAERKGVAVGHFNISTMDVVWSVFDAARSANLPVVIGVSEGEREFFGVKQIAAVVKSLREEFDYPVFLNADHTYSFEKVKEAIDAGFDSVIFDGAKLPLEENIAATKKCVDYARSVGRDVLIEGELGYIGQSSKVLDAIPQGVDTNLVSSTGEVKRFVSETGVDLLAPSIGNFHGMLRSGDEPLHIEAIADIRKAAAVPLVLHGGSGISPEDFKKAIKAGIAMIHINTELRVAYRKGLEAALASNKEEIAPYKYIGAARKAAEEAVREKLSIFNS